MTQACIDWQLTAHLQAALMIVEEMVDNALFHARTSGTLRLTWTAAGLHIAVEDHLPLSDADAQALGKSATDGKGLSIIKILALTWGISRTETGKTVWAVLAPVPSS